MQATTLLSGEKVMKKMLLVVGLVLCFGAFASAGTTTTYNFTFAGFCDGMTLNLYTPAKGIPKVLVGGVHYRYDCSNNANLGGFKTALSPDFQYDSTGAVLNVSDPALGMSGYNESLTWLINTTYGTWVVYGGSDGVGNYVLNYGAVTFRPDAEVKGEGTRPAVQPR
jgi:hypothetical protein